MAIAQRYILWLIGAVCLAVLVCLMYMHHFAWSSPQDSVAGEQAAPGFSSASGGTSTSGSAPRAAPEGMREYRDEVRHISFFYPNTLATKSYDEGGGAVTITLQDTVAAQGFQIFVLPYASAQVSRERFIQDVPSGVMSSPRDIQIGGAMATSFHSTNALLGDTAEVWVIRNGYLYEITAPKPEATWLSQILQTWQFI